MNALDALPIARGAARLAPLHERDEAMGEALLAIAHAWRRYDPDRGSWRAWARLHATHAVRRYMRRRTASLIELTAAELGQADDEELDVDACDRLRAATLVDADVVRLRLAGLTLRAAGRELGCSRQQVLRRERRVLAALEATG